MTQIKLYVNGATARAEVSGDLTSGMVGIPVQISYDDAWVGLKKVLICRSGDVTKAILDINTEVIVAHEVMIARQKLELGIEGRNADGTLVIPTVWADCGVILEGANADADPSTKPTLPVWQQILNMIGDLAKLNTDAKENLVAAVNETLTKGGGEADPAEIQRIVEEYLEENAPSASSVGAIPAPAAAEVGQYFRVSAVDENGKVTTVEAVEAPGGGGGDVWRLIRTITIPADVAADTSGITWFTTDDEAPLVRGFAFDLDDDGNAFEIEDYKLYGMVHMTGSNGIVRIGDIAMAENLNNMMYRGYRVNLGGTYSSVLVTGNRFGDRGFPICIMNTQYQPVPVLTTFTGGMPENNLDGTYPVHDLTSFAIYSEGQTFAAGDVLKLYGKEKKV